MIPDEGECFTVEQIGDLLIDGGTVNASRAPFRSDIIALEIRLREILRVRGYELGTNEDGSWVGLQNVTVVDVLKATKRRPKRYVCETPDGRRFVRTISQLFPIS
jgi:hypothetical protein